GAAGVVEGAQPPVLTARLGGTSAFRLPAGPPPGLNQFSSGGSSVGGPAPNKGIASLVDKRISRPPGSGRPSTVSKSPSSSAWPGWRTAVSCWNEADNIQPLCSTHNRWKHRLQVPQERRFWTGRARTSPYPEAPDPWRTPGGRPRR